MRLFHVSEEPDIQQFVPRSHPTWPDLAPVVWAIGETHLRNYLLPRDCPRVTFYALAGSSEADVQRYLDNDRKKVRVVVEGDWLERIRAAKLYVYELAEESFAVANEGAGYYHARRPVDPVKRHEISDLIKAIKDQGTEFETLPNLWELSDQIVTSTLQFSMIRMRNAKSRPDGRPAVFGRHV